MAQQLVTDTRRGKLEPLQTLEPGKVRMYVCGLTPYDRVHIGHARTYVAFDVIRRWLERSNDVVHVQNVTDIDDRILQRAQKRQMKPTELSLEIHREAMEDLARLRVLHPHHLPKVSDHIPHVHRMIQQLIDRGFAYDTGGNVYFHMPAFKSYGSVSGIKPDELVAGARVEPGPGKRHPGDFALWKAAKPEEGWSWDSPWGPGRPGWHIECSVMSTQILGPTMDIHGGGRDLAFPHHENESAQSEAATGEPFVRYWMHCGFLTVGGEKMSKSLNNFVTLQDALAKARPEALRLLFIGTHYRSPIDYSPDLIRNAEESLDRILVPRHRAEPGTGGAQDDRAIAAVEEGLGRIERHMIEDFDTPKALAAIHETTTALNQALDQGGLGEDAVAAVKRWYAFLDDVFAIVPAQRAGDDAPLMALLLDLRRELRAAKQFALADKVRDEIARLGYVVEDTPQGPRWRRGR